MELIKFALPILALFAVASARAESLKLTSAMCDGSFSLNSTATSIKVQGQAYIIAPAEFVLDSNDAKYCHTVKVAGVSTRLTLLRLDWASGLALFAAPANLIGGAESLTATKARLLEKVSIGSSAPARLVAVTSHRHQFPELPFAYEVEAQSAEKTSVGLTVRAPDGAILGFISSEVLVENPGHSAAVRRWVDISRASSATYLATPSSLVVTWISKVMSDPQWLPTFAVDPVDQVARQHVIHYGALTFNEHCPNAVPSGDPSATPVGGADPTGIGGADPTGIGGADPTGIGGADPTGIGGADPADIDATGRACRFIVTSGSPNTTSPIPQARRDWMQRSWLRALDSEKIQEKLSVQIGYFRDGANVLQVQHMTLIEQLAMMLEQPSRGILILPDAVFTFTSSNSATTNHPDLFEHSLLRTEHGTDAQLLKLLNGCLNVIADAMQSVPPFGTILNSDHGFLYAGLILSGNGDIITNDDLARLVKDVTEQDRSEGFLPDAQSLADAYKALHP